MVEEVISTDSRIIYDGSVFTVTVIEIINESGNLAAEVIYPNEGIVFNNRFITIPVSVVLTGTKNLICGTLESGMFRFVV